MSLLQLIRHRLEASGTVSLAAVSGSATDRTTPKNALSGLGPCPSLA
jgi:hypothetical protein